MRRPAKGILTVVREMKTEIPAYSRDVLGGAVQFGGEKPGRSCRSDSWLSAVKAKGGKGMSNTDERGESSAAMIISRRDFIKSATTLVGVAAVGPAGDLAPEGKF